jgi:hypothetical protein
MSLQKKRALKKKPRQTIVRYWTSKERYLRKRRRLYPEPKEIPWRGVKVTNVRLNEISAELFEILNRAKEQYGK